MTFSIIQIYEINDTLKSLEHLINNKEDRDMPYKCYGELRNLSGTLNSVVLTEDAYTSKTTDYLNSLDEIISEINDMIDDFHLEFDEEQVLRWIHEIRPLLNSIITACLELSLDDIDKIMEPKASLHAVLEYQEFYRNAIFSLKEKLLN